MAFSLRSFFGKGGSDPATAGAGGNAPGAQQQPPQNAAPSPFAPAANPAGAPNSPFASNLLFKTAGQAEPMGQPVAAPVLSPFSPFAPAAQSGLTVGDLLPALPQDVAKNPGLPATQPVPIPEALLENALRSGRPTLPLFEVYRAFPAMFQTPVGPHDPREVMLPAQKLSQLLAGKSPGPGAPSSPPAGNVAPPPFAASPFTPAGASASISSSFGAPPGAAEPPAAGFAEPTTLFHPSPFSLANTPAAPGDSPVENPPEAPPPMPANPAPPAAAPPSPFMAVPVVTASSPFSMAPAPPAGPPAAPPASASPMPLGSLFSPPTAPTGAPSPFGQSFGAPTPTAGAEAPGAPIPSPFSFGAAAPGGAPSPGSPFGASPFPQAPSQNTDFQPQAGGLFPTPSADDPMKGLFTPTPPPAAAPAPAPAAATPFSAGPSAPFSPSGGDFSMPPQTAPSQLPPTAESSPFGLPSFTPAPPQAPAAEGSPFGLPTPPSSSFAPAPPQAPAATAPPFSPFQAPPAEVPAAAAPFAAAEPIPAPLDNPFARIQAMAKAMAQPAPAAPPPPQAPGLGASLPDEMFGSPLQPSAAADRQMKPPPSFTDAPSFTSPPTLEAMAVPTTPVYPSAEALGGTFTMGLATGLKTCAAHDLGTVPENIPTWVKFSVPLNRVLSQVAAGRVRLTLEEILNGADEDVRRLFTAARAGLIVELEMNSVFHVLSESPSAVSLPSASAPPQPKPVAPPAAPPMAPPAADPFALMPEPGWKSQSVPGMPAAPATPELPTAHPFWGEVPEPDPTAAFAPKGLPDFQKAVPPFPSFEPPAPAAPPMAAALPPAPEVSPPSPAAFAPAMLPFAAAPVVIPANPVTGTPELLSAPPVFPVKITLPPAAAPAPAPARAGASSSRSLLFTVLLGSPEVDDVETFIHLTRQLPGVAAAICLVDCKMIAAEGADTIEAERFLREAAANAKMLPSLCALTGIEDADTLHIQNGSGEATFCLHDNIVLAVLHDPRQQEPVLREKITLLGRELAAVLRESDAC